MTTIVINENNNSNTNSNNAGGMPSRIAPGKWVVLTGGAINASTGGVAFKLSDHVAYAHDFQYLGFDQVMFRVPYTHSGGYSVYAVSFGELGAFLTSAMVDDNRSTNNLPHALNNAKSSAFNSAKSSGAMSQLARKSHNLPSHVTPGQLVIAHGVNFVAGDVVTFVLEEDEIYKWYAHSVEIIGNDITFRVPDKIYIGKYYNVYVQSFGELVLHLGRLIIDTCGTRYLSQANSTRSTQ